jgi:hypothetical protein
MGRNRRNAVAVGLVAMLAAFVPVAAAQKPHGKKKSKPKEMTFKITWTISDGTWESHYDCKCNHDDYGGVHHTDEQDHHLRFQATYDDVKIPMKGPWDVSTPVKASEWSATGSFGWDEHVWQNTNHDFPVHCQGNIEKGDEAPVLSHGRAGNESVHFIVQSGKTFKVTHVTGQNCPEGRSFTPFYPVSLSDLTANWVENMFAADALGLRDELARLKVRGVDGGQVSQQHWSHFIPPESCTWLTSGSCTEALHWDAEIRFQRTG